jgi:hypothetical protein
VQRAKPPRKRKIAAYWHRVLTEAASVAIRSASANRLRSFELKRGGRRGRGEDRGGRRGLDGLVVDELEVLEPGPGQGQRELAVAHSRDLFAKPSIRGHINRPSDNWPTT